MVLHLAYSVPNQYGGYNTGTLCGLSNKANKDENNAVDDPINVTCKKCRYIINNPSNWRYRKYINTISKQ